MPVLLGKLGNRLDLGRDRLSFYGCSRQTTRAELQSRVCLLRPSGWWLPSRPAVQPIQTAPRLESKPKEHVSRMMFCCS